MNLISIETEEEGNAIIENLSEYSYCVVAFQAPFIHKYIILANYKHYKDINFNPLYYVSNYTLPLM